MRFMRRRCHRLLLHSTTGRTKRFCPINHGRSVLVENRNSHDNGIFRRHKRYGRSAASRATAAPTGTMNDSASSSSHAMRDSYRETSGNQYSAHEGCQDMLVACAKRLRERKRGHEEWTIADLGSADGSNSIRTLEVFLDALRNNDKNDNTKNNGATALLRGSSNNGSKSGKVPSSDNDDAAAATTTSSNHRLHVFFEEHPASDEAKLTETVSSWLDTKTNATTIHDGTTETIATTITGEVLMKSFYEPLFEENSIDFCMSYICLHWLDSSDATAANDGIRGWKRLHLDDDDPPPPGQATHEPPSTGGEESLPSLEFTNATNDGTAPLEGFLHASERTAPASLKARWKTDLADLHLARFLALRARELRPGGELLVVMVGHPHGYWRPPRTEESPLLAAMKACVGSGSLRREVLERTVVPYYLRDPKDVSDALALAKVTAGSDPDDPVHALEAVEIRRYETSTGGGGSEIADDGMKGARDLFWAIHGGAVVHTGGATADETAAIRYRLVKTFDESYDASKGIVRGTFLACVFRKSIL